MAKDKGHCIEWIPGNDYKAIVVFQNCMENTSFSDCMKISLYENMFKKEYYKIWSTTKHILTLSHTQASIEKRFCINKIIEIENLKE